MKKLLLVMNPYAGTRKGNRYLADVLTLFGSRGYDVSVHMTAGPGDGADAVEQKGHGMSLIVAAGGDGTLNEVITGLMRIDENIPLGYIPCGSTNDFANSLNIPTDIMEAARAIMDGIPQQYDVGKFADRYFSYVASFGAFTKTSYETPQNVKNALGHLAYVLAGVKELFQIPKVHLAFHTDTGNFEDDYIFGAISNSTSVGGVLTLDPTLVDMQDGKFELMLIRPPKNAGELLDLVQGLSVQRYDSPMLTFQEVSSLTVWADPQMPWTLDGEKWDGAGKIQVENLQRAVSIVRKPGGV